MIFNSGFNLSLKCLHFQSLPLIILTYILCDLLGFIMTSPQALEPECDCSLTEVAPTDTDKKNDSSSTNKAETQENTNW